MGIAPDHDASLFVSPGKVYRQILSRVQRWKDSFPQEAGKDKLWRARHRSSQTAPGDQVLGLVGERGGGKTWLLHHLAEDERQVASSAVYVNLEERNKVSNPDEYVRFISARIQKACGDERAILLLDAVPAHLDDNLKALEKSVLRPHLREQGSLVLMAQVHPLRVCWRLPILRGAERYSLPPFDESQTRDQLRRLRKAKLAKGRRKPQAILAASGGLPLLNYLLATRDDVKSGKALLEYWLASVPLDDRDRVRSYLEAVCTLDVLDHAKIQKALQAYNQGRAGKGRPVAHPGDVRNMLRRHWLVRSAPESPGRLMLVDSVRRASCTVLRAQDAELYARLEAVA